VTEAGVWRRCSACKKPIALRATYWTCNVSTCTRPRTGLAFCSVSCWEVHLPEARHRESWAVERKAPATPEEAAAAAGGGAAGRESAPPRRRIVPSAPAPASKPGAPEEVLVIASRLKDYIRARSGMNTSDGVLEPLSDILRRLCDEAIRNASRDGRRTVLDRDIPRT
jgi:hypothetical protein